MDNSNNNNEKSKLRVFILTFNEELHIGRAIDSAKKLTDDIIIIDSFSTDKTIEIVKKRSVKFVQNLWPGNHADQLNWAIKECSGTASWLMRLDADEYLSQELVDNIMNVLNNDTTNKGFFLQRGHEFLGKKIKYGGSFPVSILRLWRNGYGNCENRLMDEHIVLKKGSVAGILDGYFWDANLKGISDWIIKHEQYASKECVEQLFRRHSNYIVGVQSNHDTFNIKSTKGFYERLPISIRATSYFVYRFFIRLGFLDGYKGFLWHFLQGFWYRTVVDAKVFEIEYISKSKNMKIEDVIDEKYGHLIKHK